MHSKVTQIVTCFNGIRMFGIKNTNQIVEQLIQRCQGNLDQYIRDGMLMHDHCLAIVHSLGLEMMLDQMLPVDDQVATLLRTHWVQTQLSAHTNFRPGLPTVSRSVMSLVVCQHTPPQKKRKERTFS